MEKEAIVFFGGAAVLLITAYIKSSNNPSSAAKRMGNNSSTSTIESSLKGFLERSRRILVKIAKRTAYYIKLSIEDLIKSSVFEELNSLVTDILTSPITSNIINAISIALTGLPLDLELVKHMTTALLTLRHKFITPSKDPKALPDINPLVYVGRVIMPTTETHERYITLISVVYDIYVCMQKELGLQPNIIEE